MGAAESSTENSTSQALPVGNTGGDHAMASAVSPGETTVHHSRPNDNTRAGKQRSKPHPQTASNNRNAMADCLYELSIQIRGSKRVGKSSLRKRLCGEEFDTGAYSPSVSTEESIIEWVFHTQQQQERRVAVKIEDVIDIDADELEPSGVIVLVSPHSLESLEYLKRHAASISTETPILIVYNFRDLVDDDEKANLAVSWGDVLAAAEQIRSGRLAARQRRALQLHGQLTAEQAEQISAAARDRSGSTELGSRGDLLVNVLEASMSDCYGLLLLQQYIEIPLRNKQRRQMEDKLKLLRSSIQSGHAYYELCRAKNSYSSYVEKLSKVVRPRGARRLRSGDTGRAEGHESVAHKDNRASTPPSRSDRTSDSKTAGSMEATDRSNETLLRQRDEAPPAAAAPPGPGIDEIRVAGAEGLEAFLDSSSDEAESEASDLDARGAGTAAGAAEPRRAGSSGHRGGLPQMRDDSSSGDSEVVVSAARDSQIKQLEQIEQQESSELQNGRSSPEVDRVAVGEPGPAETAQTGPEDSPTEAIVQSGKKQKKKHKGIDSVLKEDKGVSHKSKSRRATDAPQGDPPAAASEGSVINPGVATYSRLKRPVRRAATASEHASTVEPTSASAGAVSDPSTELAGVNKVAVVAVEKEISSKNDNREGGDGEADIASTADDSKIFKNDSKSEPEVTTDMHIAEPSVCPENTVTAKGETDIDSFKQDEVSDGFFADSEDD